MIEFEFENILASLGETPEEVREFHVYTYHFIDDGKFIPRAKEVLASYPNGNKYIKEAEVLLKNHGWEGDGDMGLIWFPPFIGVGVEDTYGFVCFHVKQSNNGTSWLASPEQLPFESLESHS